MDAFREDYGFYPRRICADAGYGSLLNYRYLREHGIGNYVKYNMWRQDASGENAPLFRFEGHSLVCLNGRAAEEKAVFYGRHPKAKGNKFYLVGSCRRCRFKPLCFAPVKNKKQTFRVFETSEEMYAYKKEAMENLLSVKGIEMRVNRSSQVEGVFGVIKQDMGYERVRRRGLERVSAEIMLVCLGYVMRKVFGLIGGKGSIGYWKAPEGLKAEAVPQQSLEKLIKRSARRKGENEKLRSRYKHKRGRKKKSC